MVDSDSNSQSDEAKCKQCQRSYEVNDTGIEMTHFNMACPIPFCSCPQSKIYEWHWAMEPHAGQRAYVLIDGNGTNKEVQFKAHIFECKYKCDKSTTFQDPTKQRIVNLMSHCAQFWSERADFIRKYGSQYMTVEQANKIYKFYRTLKKTLIKQAAAEESSDSDA